MNPTKYIIILQVILFLISCSNKESHLEGLNEAPEFLIRSFSDIEGEYTVSINDSLKKENNNYYKISYQLSDEAENLDDLSINFIFNKGQGSFYVDYQNRILEYTPKLLGEHNIDICVSDIYNKKSIAYLSIKVYDNLPPVPSLSFEKIDNNYRVNASRSYDPDGQIVNYHFDYGVNKIDFNEPVVEIWADHIEQNGGVTLTLTDDKGSKSAPKFFEL